MDEHRMHRHCPIVYRRERRKGILLEKVIICDRLQELAYTYEG
jgi:hypothetical protein